MTEAEAQEVLARFHERVRDMRVEMLVGTHWRVLEYSIAHIREMRKKAETAIWYYEQFPEARDSEHMARFRMLSDDWVRMEAIYLVAHSQAVADQFGVVPGEAAHRERDRVRREALEEVRDPKVRSRLARERREAKAFDARVAREKAAREARGEYISYDELADEMSAQEGQDAR